jgi:hypothetical protein
MENSNKNIYKKDAALASAGAFLILSFIFITNPQQLSAMYLLVLPILVAITSYRLTKLFIEIFTNWHLNKIRQVSLILASGPTLMIILGSLHQLGLQDVILSLLFACGFGWYLRRLSPESANSFARNI